MWFCLMTKLSTKNTIKLKNNSACEFFCVCNKIKIKIKIKTKAEIKLLWMFQYGKDPLSHNKLKHLI